MMFYQQSMYPSCLLLGPVFHALLPGFPELSQEAALLAACPRVSACFFWATLHNPILHHSTKLWQEFKLKRTSQKVILVFFFSNPSRKSLPQTFTLMMLTHPERRQAEMITLRSMIQMAGLTELEDLAWQEPWGGQLLVREEPSFGSNIKDGPQEG